MAAPGFDNTVFKRFLPYGYFSGNSGGAAGAVWVGEDFPPVEVTNTISWWNDKPEFISGIDVTCSCVEGGYPGTGNISEYAEFKDPYDPDGTDDTWGTADDGLRIALDSPARKIGLKDATVVRDVTGKGIVGFGTKVDPGAYECVLSILTLGDSNTMGFRHDNQQNYRQYLYNKIVVDEKYCDVVFVGKSTDGEERKLGIMKVTNCQTVNRHEGWGGGPIDHFLAINNVEKPSGVYNLGGDGYYERYWIFTIEQRLDSNKLNSFDLVLIMLGTNNINPNRGNYYAETDRVTYPDDYNEPEYAGPDDECDMLQQMERLLKRTRGWLNDSMPETKVFLATVPPSNYNNDEMTTFSEQIRDKYGPGKELSYLIDHLVDINAISGLKSDLKDKWHFGKDGYTKIGEKFAEDIIAHY
jgi:lysophospholipase L1-like esterase